MVSKSQFGNPANYNQVPATRQDGDASALEVDQIGNLKVAVASNPSILNATTPIYATNLVVKTSAGILRGLTGYNSKTASQFIQIHDAASLPGEGAVPVIVFTVPTVANFSLDFGQNGRQFYAGIVICNSSTAQTKTIGSADIWLDVQYM